MSLIIWLVWRLIEGNRSRCLVENVGKLRTKIFWFWRKPGVQKCFFLLCSFCFITQHHVHRWNISCLLTWYCRTKFSLTYPRHDIVLWSFKIAHPGKEEPKKNQENPTESNHVVPLFAYRRWYADERSCGCLQRFRAQRWTGSPRQWRAAALFRRQSREWSASRPTLPCSAPPPCQRRPFPSSSLAHASGRRGSRVTEWRRSIRRRGHGRRSWEWQTRRLTEAFPPLGRFPRRWRGDGEEK